jgi:putative Holliday junction resolvase
MTKILGIDYGRKKIGLARADGSLAEPWKVIKVEDFEEAVAKVLRVLGILQVDKVIVGVSEGRMGEESEKFAERIGAETFDETLSTHDAQELSKEAKIAREKRKNLEDAYAACVMLQSYLDNYV